MRISNRVESSRPAGTMMHFFRLQLQNSVPRGELKCWKKHRQPRQGAKSDPNIVGTSCCFPVARCHNRLHDAPQERVDCQREQ